jgi:hypothetical protein
LKRLRESKLNNKHWELEANQLNNNNSSLLGVVDSLATLWEALKLSHNRRLLRPTQPVLLISILSKEKL